MEYREEVRILLDSAHIPSTTDALNGLPVAAAPHVRRHHVVAAAMANNEVAARMSRVVDASRLRPGKGRKQEIVAREVLYYARRAVEVAEQLVQLLPDDTPEPVKELARDAVAAAHVRLASACSVIQELHLDALLYEEGAE